MMCTVVSKARLSGVSLSALVLLLASGAASAQGADAGQAGAAPAATADDGALGEIVVTANRRSEPLQKVGIAVNAFSGAQLQSLGITNSQDITKFTPAVASTGAQGGFLQTISIRGVTQNDYNPHQEAPVAAYIDDVYISSVQGQSFATFDTERVEILKGPQGTLFGRNATGGLVNYITVKPSEDFTGYVAGKYGRFNEWEVQGAVGGPIVGDQVMFRVSGIYNGHGAVLKNPVGPDGWKQASYAGRAQLLLRPSDNFEALFSARYGKATISVTGANQFPAEIAIYNEDGNQIDGRYLGRNETAVGIGPNGPFGTRPVAGGDFFGYVDPDGDGRVSADPLVGGPVSYTTSKGHDKNYSESYGVTSRMTGHINDDLTLINTMDYSHFKWRSGNSLLGGTAIFGFDTFANGIKQMSDEFRILGDYQTFRWTVGAYYLNIDTDAGTAYGFLPGGLTGDGTVPGDQTSSFRQQTSSISVFAQGEYDLTPELTAIVGGRYIKDRKEFSYTADLVTATGQEFFNIFQFNPDTTSQAKLSQNLWAGKLGLNYKPTQDLLIYATVNRGVKGGGFNAPSNPLALTTAEYVFKPEKIMAYEAGFKSTIAPRTTLNASGFYYDYRNYQGYKSIGTTNFIVNNKARVYGAEVELRANPIRHLDALIGASYTNSKVKDVQLAPGYLVDRRPAFSPRLQLNGLVRYEIPSSIGKFALQADASYRSTYYLQLVNYQTHRQKGYPLVNARASLAGNDRAGWEVYGAVKNITDERYMVSSFDVSAVLGNGNVAYNMPRTWEVGLRFDW